jgi:hypothetical protein
MTRRATTPAPKRAETVALASGRCRICGCTELSPCILLVVDGDFTRAIPVSSLSLDYVALDRPLPHFRALLGCFWIDRGKTLCSNPRCVAHVPLDDLLRMGYGVEDLSRELVR